MQESPKFLLEVTDLLFTREGGIFSQYSFWLLMRTGRYLELGLQSIQASDIAVTRQLRFSIDAITETGNLPCITHEVCDKVGNFHNPQ